MLHHIPRDHSVPNLYYRNGERGNKGSNLLHFLTFRGITKDKRAGFCAMCKTLCWLKCRGARRIQPTSSRHSELRSVFAAMATANVQGWSLSKMKQRQQQCLYTKIVNNIPCHFAAVLHVIPPLPTCLYKKSNLVEMFNCGQVTTQRR